MLFLRFFVLLWPKYQLKFKNIMKRNFLPQFVGISMTKSQFCFCTGLTPYNLTKIIHRNYDKLHKIGLGKYDKLLMPAVVREILAITGLQIDLDYYSQYVAGQRGINSTQLGS